MSGRILTNGRSPMNKAGDYVTRQQVEHFVEAYVDKHIEHYMGQVPELVARMMADMCAANGLTFQGPIGPVEVIQQPEPPYDPPYEPPLLPPDLAPGEVE
jgi:hypothetical protein